jgi:hypothetical protein
MSTHKTAITRSSLSVPARNLQESGLIRGRVLDYGSGRGGDASFLKSDSYDPYYNSTHPEGPYDTILCTYVLNVLESAAERVLVISKIKKLLAKDGTAYVTVRRDVKDDPDSVRPATQFDVNLNYPSVKKTSTYEIYKVTK